MEEIIILKTHKVLFLWRLPVMQGTSRETCEKTGRKSSIYPQIYARQISQVGGGGSNLEFPMENIDFASHLSTSKHHPT